MHLDDEERSIIYRIECSNPGFLNYSIQDADLAKEIRQVQNQARKDMGFPLLDN